MAIRLFILGFVLSTNIALAGSSVGQVDFFYSPKPDAHEPIIDAIDAAKKTIKMKMFHMSNPTIAAALMFAAKRGVDVQVIFDKSQWKSTNDQKINQDMIDAGVKVVKATTGFSITHEKAMIIDDRKAMISTMNMIRRYTQMVDFGVFVYNQDIIREMNEVFATDWKNASENTAATPELSNPYLIWSPINTEEKLLNLISSAKNEVEVIVENLGHPKIHQALINASNRGVGVRVITPQCNLTKLNLNYRHVVALRNAGVDAKMYPGPSSEKMPYIHAKSIVVDHDRSYIGSVNFSQNSVNYAREVGVILPDEDIAVKVGSIFTTLWKDAVLPPPDENYSCLKEPGSAGPGDQTFWTRLLQLFIL